MLNFKHIHIGQMIKERIAESGIEMSRICNFLKCSKEEIEKMYTQKNLYTDILLKWSKLLDYDFFRIYTQHLILYAPAAKEKSKQQEKQKSSSPQFRKNIYTKEIINFVLEQINTKEMTRTEVMKRYGIPKTTLYKWISKYKNLSNI